MRDIRQTEVRKVGRPEPKPDRVGDVVFVHGLNEDPHETWSNGSEDGFWPGWLAEDCPNLDFWYVGYQAAARGGREAAMPLVFRADNVLAALKSHGLGTKPLCFITHSMGGLLVKQMLRRAESYEDFKSFSEVTRGVVFFSTPHKGAGLANLARYFRFLQFSVAVQELENYATPLVDLSEWYSGSVNRLHIKTQVYYENVPTRRGPFPFNAIVVDRESADPGISGIPLIGVDADHNGICKLSSKDIFIYERIKKFVLEVLTSPPRTRRSRRSMSQQRMSDRQIFQAWRIAFDSSVFKGPWRLQSDLFRAKQGIEDIINAVNTGDIRGSTVKGKGRIFLENKEWFSKMEDVASRLDRIRDLVNKLEELRTHAPIGWAAATLVQEGKWDPNAPNEISDKIDHERDEIIETMNEIWKALKIPTLIKPSEVKTS